MYYRPGLWHYTLVTKITPGDNCHGWSPSILRMVAHQPKYGHPPTLGWSPTRRKCTTDLEFSTYILLTKLTSGYLLTKLTPGYLPTLRGSHTRRKYPPRLGTWHLDPKEGSMLQTRNLALRLESQTIPRMVVTYHP